MAKVVEENTKRGVAVQAWSPLQRALQGPRKAACAEIGKKYGKSAAQVHAACRACRTRTPLRVATAWHGARQALCRIY